MHPFRQLGRSVERFRQIALAAAAETAPDASDASDASDTSTHDDGSRSPDGSPSPDDARSPHDVLGVTPDAPEPVVRAAARERLKLAHPDQGGSAEEFRRVKLARDRLLDS